MESKLVSEHDILLALDSVEAVMPVDCKRAFKAMRRAITVLPAADGAPVKRGEWLDTGLTWKGSCCGREISTRENFCPNCGAKMKEE